MWSIQKHLSYAASTVMVKTVRLDFRFSIRYGLAWSTKCRSMLHLVVRIGFEVGLI